MAQLQRPIFPAGVTPINHQIAIACESGKVVYVHGHLPVFQHGSEDLASFRLITSQMIASGTVRPSEIVRTFGVPLGTVKRYVKKYREQGAKGFFAVRRRRSASVLKEEMKARVQALLDTGQSVPEAGRELNLLPNTLHKAIRAGRLHLAIKQKTRESSPPSAARASVPTSIARRRWGTPPPGRWHGWAALWAPWSRLRSTAPGEWGICWGWIGYRRYGPCAPSWNCWAAKQGARCAGTRLWPGSGSLASSAVNWCSMPTVTCGSITET